MAAAGTRRKLLFFVSEDFYFVSHRLPIALAAQAQGYDVCVVTRVRTKADPIVNAGIRLIPFELDRGGVNPLRDADTLRRLVRIYQLEQPDIVHHVAMKPVLYGSLAARLAGRPRVVNALPGLGWMFTTGAGTGRRLLQVAVRSALVRALNSGLTIVQNDDDERLLVDCGVRSSGVRTIRGSGADLTRFHPCDENPGDPVVVLPARLLWDKGVAEFVAAAKLLRARGVHARFVLAGEPDPENPATVTPEELHRWVMAGIVEHLGWISDMPTLLGSAHIVCLPSYREGMPKALIEAAAAGLPIVTTDVPGCRDVVTNGENGLLVPARDARALADALERLITDPDLRRVMGARGRKRAMEEFDVERVIEQTLDVYREALS